jgi:hypothetical protein
MRRESNLDSRIFRAKHQSAGLRFNRVYIQLGDQISNYLRTTFEFERNL